MHVSAGALKAPNSVSFRCVLDFLYPCFFAFVVNLVVCFVFSVLVTFRSDWAPFHWRTCNRKAHGFVLRPCEGGKLIYCHTFIALVVPTYAPMVVSEQRPMAVANCLRFFMA